MSLDRRHKWILTKKREDNGSLREWWKCSSCGKKQVEFHWGIAHLNHLTKKYFLPEMRKNIRDDWFVKLLLKNKAN